MHNERSEASNRPGFSHFLMALIGGAAAGATVAYLTAPRSGSDSRRRLQHVADTARDSAARFPVALRRATEAAREAFTETLQDGADS